MDNPGDCLRVKEDAVENEKEDGPFSAVPNRFDFAKRCYKSEGSDQGRLGLLSFLRFLYRSALEMQYLLTEPTESF